MTTPFVADPPAASAMADDPLARSVARLVLGLARQLWRPEGPASVRPSSLAKHYGPIEPGAVDSLVASGYAVRLGDRPDSPLRSTGLALAVGGFGATAIELPSTTPDGGPVPALLVDLARTGLPSVPAEGLAFHLGRDVDDLWAALGELAAAGLADLWPDHPAGPAASLSPYGMGCLGLRLAPDGSRWLRANDPDPAPSRPFGAAEDDDGPDPIDFATDDREIGGLDALILAETVAEARRARLDQIDDHLCPERERERREARRRENVARTVERRRLKEACARLPAAERKARLRELDARHEAERWAAIRDRIAEQPEPVSLTPPPPQPFRVFLGMRHPWPVPVGPREAWHPWRPSDGPCPECGDRPLVSLAVCLHCHRSGLDDILGPVRRSPVARGSGKRSEGGHAPMSNLKGGIG